MSDVFLSVCGIGIVSLVYVCLVSVMFFMKGRIKRISSKFFSAFLILTIFTILVYVISGIISLNNYELAQIFGRFTVFIFTSWEIMLIVYLFIVFKNEKFNKEFFKIHKKKFLLSRVNYTKAKFVQKLLIYISIFKLLKNYAKNTRI